MRKFVLFLTIVFSLLFSSCINYNDEIKINKDLSGTMSVEFLIPNSLLGGELGKGFEKYIQEAEENAKKVKGIELLEAKIIPEGSQTKYRIRLKFNSFENLEKYFKEYKDEKKDSPYNFKIFETEEGIKFERIITPTESKDKKRETEEDKMAESFAQSILANNIWSFKITFPYEVIKTNGDLQEDKKTVIWKYDLYTLAAKGVKMEATIKKPSLIDKIIEFFMRIINTILSIFK